MIKTNHKRCSLRIKDGSIEECLYPGWLCEICPVHEKQMKYLEDMKQIEAGH